MTDTPAPGDPAMEWRRSSPDIIVYLPRGGDHNDTDNEHFLVFQSPAGDLLAMWTQSSREGFGDNHIVIARSRDGEDWSEPSRIVGPSKGSGELQASWGFPVVSAQGRIYCFYVQLTDVIDTSHSCCGVMGCAFSDDDGHTWAIADPVPMARNRFDHPDPSYPRNWIVWQKPVRDSRGRWMAGYTQSTSLAVRPEPPDGWWSQDTRCWFMRFDNIDEGPDPADIRITWLPHDEEGLSVPYPEHPEISVAQEPSIVLLPDGRLFTTMRTFTGHIWYSVSQDDGDSWHPPEVLRRCDDGEPMRQPIAPCPIYPFEDGTYLLVFHNNDGHVGPYGPRDVMFNRRPAFVAVGTYHATAHQPVWFGEPKQILDTDGVPLGPKGTAEIATYTSLTHWRGQWVLWYPDRKYYLLGKRLTPSLLE